MMWSCPVVGVGITSSTAIGSIFALDLRCSQCSHTSSGYWRLGRGFSMLGRAGRFIKSVRYILLLSSKLLFLMDRTSQSKWKSLVWIIILSLNAEDLSSNCWFQMKYTSVLVRRMCRWNQRNLNIFSRQSNLPVRMANMYNLTARTRFERSQRNSVCDWFLTPSWARWSHCFEVH